MARDRLRAHLRDELGMSKQRKPRPVQAAAVSAASFASLALLPLLGLLVAMPIRILAMAGVSLLGLSLLGAASARLGGAPAGPAALRVTIGGGLAMAATAVIGRLVGAATGP
jgi:VIT1/CCC1 family predicted Fe2+/Mn2+ transporter